MTPLLARITARRTSILADRPSRETGRPVSQETGRPIGGWGLTGLAVMSLGGPLAIAALIAPGIVADASASAGLVMVAAAVVFAAPLLIWLRYARHVSSAGGLYAFTQAAAGRRVALVQAGLWITSYLLYLLYTTAQIVYSVLPAVFPGIRPVQPALEILIPVALAGVMIAGRRAMLVVAGALAAGQIAITAALSGVTIAHLGAPAASFSASAPAGTLPGATGQTALLYICGSLPLFLGGEVRPGVTMRRGLTVAYLAVAAVVILAVFPLAAAPAFTRAAIPGVSVAEVLAGRGFAIVVGVGVAVSIAGVILAEYVAVGRLLHAVTSRSLRSINVGLGAVMVVAAPVTLIGPVRIYDDLEGPSIVLLWLSQLIVFAAYPRFAARNGHGKLAAWPLTAVAVAFCGYGLWTSISQLGG